MGSNRNNFKLPIQYATFALTFALILEEKKNNKWDAEFKDLHCTDEIVVIIHCTVSHGSTSLLVKVMFFHGYWDQITIDEGNYGQYTFFLSKQSLVLHTLFSFAINASHAGMLCYYLIKGQWLIFLPFFVQVALQKWFLITGSLMHIVKPQYCFPEVEATCTPSMLKHLVPS